MPWQFLHTASSYAGDVDALIVLVTVLVGFWFILTFGMFLWLIFKFQAKDGVKAQYVTGDEPHLKRWISIPHGLVLFCDVFIIIGAVKVWFEIKLDRPPADETVKVISQQWAWVFQHAGADGQLDTADDIKTVNELRVEVNKTYHFILSSRDVLHSFAIPSFRLKQDAIPGREITGWFKPIETGEFDIQCAEICGVGHGLMPAKLVVESAENHAAWVSEHTPSLASR